MERPGDKIKGERDPVCGLEIDHLGAKHQSALGGEVYYFCSAECKKRFETEPEKYSSGVNEEN